MLSSGCVNNDDIDIIQIMDDPEEIVKYVKKVVII